MTIDELLELFLRQGAISTDSRQITPGAIFFALKGEHFDGHKFVHEVFEKGASYAVVDDTAYVVNDRCLLFNNVLATLQSLATAYRKKFDIPLIAIAGSNGKTTTKELMAAVLKTTFETFATPGNFNNEIGLPITLLRMPVNTEAAVIEMGARKRGDIGELCIIAEPNYGLVTNTGKDHLETFGTLENTTKTNAELYKYLSEHKGIVFLNTAHNYLVDEAKSVGRQITYGFKDGVDYKGWIVSAFPYLHIGYQSEEGAVLVQSQLVGKYNFENIMAAVAVGKKLGVPDRLIKRAIEGYKPTNNRSQLVQHESNTYILDAYNANPTSMAEALDNFDEIEADHKLVVLGDMLELGAGSQEEHLLIVLKLKQMELDHIVLVGPEFGKVKDKLDCQHFENAEQAGEWFGNQHIIDSLVLLKGSRGIGLEQVVAPFISL